MRAGRLGRIAFFFTAFLIAFITGTYYAQVPVMRVLHHALVTVVIVGYLLWAARKGGLPSSVLSVPILLAIVLWIGASLISVDARIALENAWFPISHAVIALFAIDLARRGRSGLLVEGQFLLGAVTAMFALPQFADYLRNWLSLGMLPLVTPMVFMPLGVSTWLAAYCAPLVVLAFGYGLAERRRVVRIALWVLAGALAIALVGAFSRGGFVALAIGGAVFLLLRGAWGLVVRRPNQTRSSVTMARALIPAIVVIAIAAAGVLLIGRSIARSSGDALRLNLWRDAIDVIADHPVTGVGVGLFGRTAREYREYGVIYDDRLSTAHNAYLNTTAETGVIGAALMLTFGVVIVRAGWRRWRGFITRSETAPLIRHEAAIAALIGFGAQSLFDTFVMVPLALLTIVLVVLVTIEPAEGAVRRTGSTLPYVMAVILVVAGVGLIYSDTLYMRFRGAENLDGVRAVIAADPNVGLYRLQAAVLENTEAAYAAALAIAPTWDVGWVNRAALAEERGDYSVALEYLDRARTLNIRGNGSYHWARVAETYGLADDAAVVDAYHDAMAHHMLPLSPVWTETPLRLQALERVINDVMTAEYVDLAYRIARVQTPERLATIVEAARGWTSGPALWVLAQETLTADARAVAFDHPIAVEPRRGDFYVSRADARIGQGPDDPLWRDLRMAELLGTQFEFPNALRAEAAQNVGADIDTIRAYWAGAVPPIVIDLNFDGISYAGRVGDLALTRSMRLPGPGAGVLQPWYSLAASYEQSGETELAVAVRRAIAAREP